MLQIQSIEKINVDELSSKALENRQAWTKREEEVFRRRGKRVPPALYNDRRGARFKIKTLMHQWRQLEARSYALTIKAERAHKEQWDFLIELGHRFTSSDKKTLWLIDEENITVYDHSRTSTYGTTAERLVADCMGQPSKSATIVPEKLASQYFRLEKRANTAQTRAGVFRHAFIISIETRLSDIVESKGEFVPSIGRSFTKQCAFLFSNEGPNYLVVSNVEQSAPQFMWLDGTFFKE